MVQGYVDPWRDSLNARYLRRPRREEPLKLTAWDKFFCYGCVTERPIASKVKFKARVLCEECADAARGVRKNGKTIGRKVEVDDEPDVIPQSIMEAYAEARQTSD